MSKRPNPIDAHVGGRVRLRRTMLGMSQERLGDCLGLTFQQIQKYEKGATTISVSRLQQIAKALGIEITVFFREDTKGAMVRDVGTGYGPEGDSLRMNQPLTPEEIRLLKLFRKTKNKKVREGILQQMRGIIELENTEKQSE